MSLSQNTKQNNSNILNTHKVLKPMQLIKEEEDLDQTRLEIIKAVAQAWHGHTNRSSSTTINTREAEPEPCRHKFKAKPSRFKIERLKHLLNKASSSSNNNGGDVTAAAAAAAYWDFGQSLWDSYEVVSVCKQLENGIVLERAFAKPYCSRKLSVGKNRESVNSLRYLFNHMSSRRFSEPKDE